MKIGVCCGNDISKFELLKKYNFDYYESCFNQLVTMSDADIAKMAAESEKTGLLVESCNGFFSSNINIYDGFDCEIIKAFAEKGFSRFTSLGGKVAVLGSGGVRRIPEGYDKALARKQFIETVKICGDAAAKYGAMIAIEPLRYSETNFINTVAEGIEICREAGHENVKCLADFFHVFMNDEGLEAIENSNGMLIHTHIARPNPDRNMPTIADIEGCRPWAEALKKCHYKGRMSLEGGMKPDFETALRDIQPVLELFKSI